jgi:hypothetical protein
MHCLQRFGPLFFGMMLFLSGTLASGQDSPCDPDAAKLRFEDDEVGYQKRSGSSEAYCEGLCTLKIGRSIDREIRVYSVQVQGARPSFDDRDSWTLTWPWLNATEKFTPESNVSIQGSSLGLDSQYRLDANCARGAKAEYPTRDNGGFGAFDWGVSVLRASKERFNLIPEDVHFRIQQDVVIGERSKAQQVFIPTVLNPQACEGLPEGAPLSVSIRLAGRYKTLTNVKFTAYPTPVRKGMPPSPASELADQLKRTPKTLTQSQRESLVLLTTGIEGQIITIEISFKGKSVGRSGGGGGPGEVDRPTESILVYIPTREQIEDIIKHEWP